VFERVGGGGGGLLCMIIETKREETAGDWKDYIMRSCMICVPHQMLFVLSNKRR